ncbi:Wzy polymerase domain-containing protein [Klebsiella aerogenes]|uniref:PglL family O-oligosaccharyltransferase n=1 Tax=Klebsiella aerogenes TaxID=548 RepID=UPI002E335985|nr:Wzy polymerase domain-containing protein [Klebsiella aerogenes]MED7793076.1 Wzy polymerase domain-containing protein [Klebsiella aerogenes]
MVLKGFVFNHFLNGTMVIFVERYNMDVTKSYNNRTSWINAENIIVGGINLYWLVGLHIAWNNSGGWGIDLPYNLIAWGGICTLCTLFWAITTPRKVVLGTTGRLLIIGTVLLCLPVLWSPSVVAIDNALPRLGGMWAGCLFWFTLRQCSFNQRQCLWLMYGLVIAGVIEAGIVFIELNGPAEWLPSIWQTLIKSNGRGAVGVFQQVNVTASFLVTSLAVVLLLITMRKAILSHTKLERIRLCCLVFSGIFICAITTALYSRTGWIAEVIVVTGLFWLLNLNGFRHEGRSQPLLLIVPATGIFVGLYLMPLSVHQALQAHDGSTHQRALTIYYTIKFITLHPLLGYGAGTFEGAYQHFLALLPGGNPGREMMAHPHNEILYQYAEGGIVALAGIVIWSAGLFRLWKKSHSVLSCGALICMLPILIHSQLEYPLYYSVPHYLVLLILLRLAEDSETNEEVDSKPENIHRGFIIYRLVMCIVFLYGSIVSLQSYRVWATLELFERSMLTHPEHITEIPIPWVMRLHYKQDRALLRLFVFNQKKDPSLLRKFTEENAMLISVHSWPVLYQNQISVLRFLNDDEGVKFWEDRERNTFPWLHKSTN